MLDPYLAHSMIELKKEEEEKNTVRAHVTGSNAYMTGVMCLDQVRLR